MNGAAAAAMATQLKRQRTSDSDPYTKTETYSLTDMSRMYQQYQQQAGPAAAVAAAPAAQYSAYSAQPAQYYNPAQPAGQYAVAQMARPAATQPQYAMQYPTVAGGMPGQNPAAVFGATQYAQNSTLTVAPPNCRTVYIGNVDETMTLTELLDVVRGGMVESAQLLLERHCAFISFVDQQGAQIFFHDATTNPGSVTIRGKPLKVGWSKNVSVMPHQVVAAVSQGASRAIYIGNVVDTNLISPELLTKDLSSYGTVEAVRFMPEKKCIFVHMSNIQDAVTAIASLKTREPYTKFKVNYAKDRCDRPINGMKSTNNPYSSGPQALANRIGAPPVPYTASPGTMYPAPQYFPSPYGQMPAMSPAPGQQQQQPPPAAGGYTYRPNVPPPPPQMPPMQQQPPLAGQQPPPQPPPPTPMQQQPQQQLQQQPQPQQQPQQQQPQQPSMPPSSAIHTMSPPTMMAPPQRPPYPPMPPAHYMQMQGPRPPMPPFIPGQVPPPLFQRLPPVPKDQRVIYIGGLPEGTTPQDLCAVVRAGGPLLSIKILPEKHCAFLSFVDSSAAAMLLVFGNAVAGGIYVNGQRLNRVAWAKDMCLPRGVSEILAQGASRNLYLGSINLETMTQESLLQDFSIYGEVEQVHILVEKRTAFVNFCEVQSAAKAMDAMLVQTTDPTSKYSGCRVSYGKDRCAGEPRNVNLVLAEFYQSAQLQQQLAQGLRPLM